MQVKFIRTIKIQDSKSNSEEKTKQIKEQKKEQTKQDLLINQCTVWKALQKLKLNLTYDTGATSWHVTKELDILLYTCLQTQVHCCSVCDRKCPSTYE